MHCIFPPWLAGSYRFQGRTAGEARAIVSLATKMADAGAAGILLEAVPPEISKAVVDAVGVPVIGCGAGPACDAHVFVTHDAIGLSQRTPRFVPHLGDVAQPMISHFGQYVRLVQNNEYPSAEHCYEMPADEKQKFVGEKTVTA